MTVEMLVEGLSDRRRIAIGSPSDRRRIAHWIGSDRIGSDQIPHPNFIGVGARIGSPSDRAYFGTDHGARIAPREPRITPRGQPAICPYVLSMDQGAARGRFNW